MRVSPCRPSRRPVIPRPPAQPRRSRKPDYDRLPQVRIEHDVPEAEKLCSHCGEPKARIGEDEARVLQFVPAHFELHVHVLPKYACSHCRDGVVAPEPPPRPVSGCIAGAGPACLRWSSRSSPNICRCIDSRISRTRYGLYLSRSTLCDWVGKIADLLAPLYELQKEPGASGRDVIWTDDTPVTVLGRRKAGEPHGAVLGLHRPRRCFLTTCMTSRRIASGTALRRFPGELRGISASRRLQRL